MRKALVGALMLLFLLPGNSRSEDHYDLDVHFIDVGQGGAVLIQFKGKNILYDCGDTPMGKEVVEYLKDQKVKIIDLLIASHAHKDHIGGCIHVMEKVEVKKVYDNGSKSKTRTYKKFKELARNREYETVTKDFKEGPLEFLVAYDTREKLSEADRSILVKLVHNKVSFLFTGDCEKACEHEVLKESNVDVDILLVGHHGSNDSSTREFLEKVTPKIAVVQVGAGNPYEHPRKEALQRLNTVGARIYRTDQDGTVVIRSDGRDIDVETEK